MPQQPAYGRHGIAKEQHPSRVSVLRGSPEGGHAGILADSVVMTDNLATIAEREIDQRIGFLPMTKVGQALKHTLGLGEG